MTKTPNQRWLHQILILIVILLAAWLRLWRLAEVTPGFWYDEAYNAMDARWMLETRSPQPFFVGNNGREPMIHYLGALSMSVLGATPFAFRLVSALTGILTVSLTYHWVIILFARSPDRRWLALFTAGGLASSFWHVLMSHTGFRAILVPFFVMLTAGLFWYGWQHRSWLHFAMAGIALGLSQYTYLSARLLPLVFALFTLAWVAFGKRRFVTGTAIHSTSALSYLITQWRSQSSLGDSIKASLSLKKTSDRHTIWLGLSAMAVVSFVVFLPLGLFYLNNSAAFSARTGQVFVGDFIAQGRLSVTAHLLDALSVFGVGHDALWQLGLVGQPSFGWINIGAFWLGLIMAVLHFRQSNYLFLLITLFILWLPALLTSPPAVHALHLSGFLPAYYTIVASVLVTLTSVLARPLFGKKLRQQYTTFGLKLTVFTLFLIINGGVTIHNYFTRWANEPVVYKEYNGSLVDLTRYLIAESHNADILLPFQVYAQPATRLLLYDEFRETSGIHTAPLTDRPVIYVDPKPILTSRLHHVRSSSFVWLTRDKQGHGIAYVSRQPPPDNFALTPAGETFPFVNRYTGDLVALLTPLESIEPALPLFNQWPASNRVDYDWGHQFRLVSYQLSATPTLSGHTVEAKLYWQLLTDATFDEHDIFIGILNNQGVLIGQTKLPAKELFRWRQGGSVISTHRTIAFNPKLKPGTYMVRLSLLNGNKRVSIYTPDGKSLDDQIILETFHIVEEDSGLQTPSQ